MALAACRAPGPPLSVPTIAATAIIQASPTGADPGQVSPTATLPPAPTAVLPTSTPAPVATSTSVIAPTPTQVAPTQVVATQVVAPPPVSHQVAFVAGNDTLNVRSGPGADYPAVAALPPDTGGILIAGDDQSLVSGSTWVPVETDAGEGWVNSRFLTETVGGDEFCGDPAVADLLAQLQTAIAAQDGARLQSLVHPERGLRLRINWWNEEIFLPGTNTRTLFSGRPSFDWGIADGSGLPIEGSFADVMLPLLQQDLLGATVWACDEIAHGPTAGAVVLPEGYEQLHFYSAHRTAPASQEFDWGTWVIGIDRWEGAYYLSYLIHYHYEI